MKAALKMVATSPVRLAKGTAAGMAKIGSKTRSLFSRKGKYTQ